MKLPRIWNRSDNRFMGVDVYGPNEGKLWHRLLVAWPYSLDEKRRDAVLWAFYRIHPNHRYNRIETRLPARYYENTTRLLHGMFAVFCDHVEEHGYKNLVESIAEMEAEFAAGISENYSLDHLRIYKEKVELYNWWTIHRPQREKLCDELIDHLYTKPFVMVPDWENPGRFLTKTPLRARIDILKQEREDTDIAMMHRLVDIRDSLWT